MANVEALQQLRRVVLEAPEGRFEMGEWQDEGSCGTTRCAAGWAALDPWHRANTTIGDIFPVVLAEGGLSIDMSEVDMGAVEIADALAPIYGISVIDSSWLFIPLYEGVSKGEVVANIDRLIQGGPAVPYGGER